MSLQCNRFANGVFVTCFPGFWSVYCEVLRPVTVIFWATTACSSIHAYGRFGRMYLLKGRVVIQSRNDDLKMGGDTFLRNICRRILNYVGVLISLWLFLYSAQPKEFFLDGLKKLEQRSYKYVELWGEYVE
jgi:hypothetical protein